MRTFRDLLIWRKSMALVTKTYEFTKQFPREEIFGLTSQIRRCAVSIPSNIAEGYGRQGNKEFSRFLTISISSLFEFQTQIEISKNVRYLTETEFNNLYQDSRELEAMIVSFAKKVSKDL